VPERTLSVANTRGHGCRSEFIGLNFCANLRRVKQDRQCKRNITLRRVRELLLPWNISKYHTFCMCVCGLIYPACKEHAPYNTVWCGQSPSITYFHINS